MAGLCEGGNEPSGSLKASKQVRTPNKENQERKVCAGDEKLESPEKNRPRELLIIVDDMNRLHGDDKENKGKAKRTRRTFVKQGEQGEEELKGRGDSYIERKRREKEIKLEDKKKQAKMEIKMKRESKRKGMKGKGQEMKKGMKEKKRLEAKTGKKHK
ncbi:hypothetical protein ANN_15425 [Periplaneta americana]|uniref:Uncharacterized protein n=1 Tax=Periplaneta americana TaxID=6978 RepID=A0ABQ8SGC9_PERAM|nr:hypothetical protein ANN_15425 [Periplaneta americana]